MLSTANLSLSTGFARLFAEKLGFSGHLSLEIGGCAAACSEAAAQPRSI
jgi:hypothetical protein